MELSYTTFQNFMRSLYGLLFLRNKLKAYLFVRRLAKRISKSTYSDSEMAIGLHPYSLALRLQLKERRLRLAELNPILNFFILWDGGACLHRGFS